MRMRRMKVEKVIISKTLVGGGKQDRLFKGEGINLRSTTPRWFDLTAGISSEVRLQAAIPLAFTSLLIDFRLCT